MSAIKTKLLSLAEIKSMIDNQVVPLQYIVQRIQTNAQQTYKDQVADVQLAKIQKELDEARDAHRKQQQNYIELYEAVIGGGGCITAECHDIIKIANKHREVAEKTNSILYEVSGQLKLLYRNQPDNIIKIVNETLDKIDSLRFD